MSETCKQNECDDDDDGDDNNVEHLARPLCVFFLFCFSCR